MLATAIAYSAVAMISYGVGNALLKILTSRIGVVESLIFRNLVAVPVLLLAWFAFGAPFPTDIQASDAIGAAFIALLGYVPFYLFLRALKVGDVGTVVPVTSARIIISVFFGALFLSDALSRVDIIGILGIVAGVAFVTFAVPVRTVPLIQWLPAALGAALLWGVLYPLFGFYSGVVGALFYALCIELAVLVGGVAHVLFKNRSFVTVRADFAKLDRHLLVPLVVAGLLTAIGSLTLNFGYLTGEIGIVSAIGGASAVASALAAIALFKERISVLQWGGILLVVGCIALIALQ